MKIYDEHSSLIGWVDEPIILKGKGNGTTLLDVRNGKCIYIQPLYQKSLQLTVMLKI